MAETDTSILIHQDERLEDLRLGGLRILQKKNGFRFGMDAVLLSDFANIHAGDVVADFGTGTGILCFLLYGRQKGCRFEAFEVQQDMAEMAERSVQLNQLEQYIHIYSEDLTRAPEILGTRCVNAVICNPPYGISGKTIRNPSATLSLARHQGEEGMDPWFRTASKVLKPKGRFAMIYPASRMLEAMDGLRRWQMEPKRFRMVYPGTGKAANLVMIEAVLYARPMLHAQPPLIVYDDKGHMTPELMRIYHMEQEAEQPCGT